MAAGTRTKTSTTTITATTTATTTTTTAAATTTATTTTTCSIPTSELLCSATSQNQQLLQCSTAYYAPLSPGYPNPLFGTYMFYFLKHCPPQVKTCFGCGQTLKPGGQIGEPLYDLVIVSNAKRSYYDRAGQLQERPRNVYQHVNAGA